DFPSIGSVNGFTFKKKAKIGRKKSLARISHGRGIIFKTILNRLFNIRQLMVVDEIHFLHLIVFLMLCIYKQRLTTTLAFRLLKQRYAQNGQKDRKSTRLNSSHVKISYAVFCLKKK